MPLGMEDYRILSGHLRASSSYNYNHGPDRARLNIYNSHGRTGAWVAKHRNTHQYLQIDLRELSIIKGIATQGRREAHQWVTKYQMSYSRFGARFKSYVSYGRVKVSKPLISLCVMMPVIYFWRVRGIDLAGCGMRDESKIVSEYGITEILVAGFGIKVLWWG